MWCILCGQDSELPVCDDCLDTKQKNTLLIMLETAEVIEDVIMEESNV